MQLHSASVSVSVKLCEVSGFQAYGKEGQAGRGPKAMSKLEAERDLHYEYFHWLLCRSGKPLWKESEWKAIVTGGGGVGGKGGWGRHLWMRTCWETPSGCPDPTDLRGFLSTYTPIYLWASQVLLSFSGGKSHDPSLEQTTHFRTNAFHPGPILWHVFGNQKRFLLRQGGLRRVGENLR